LERCAEAAPSCSSLDDGDDSKFLLTYDVGSGTSRSESSPLFTRLLFYQGFPRSASRASP
jgi:hypothetical protein